MRYLRYSILLCLALLTACTGTPSGETTNQQVGQVNGQALPTSTSAPVSPTATSRPQAPTATLIPTTVAPTSVPTAAAASQRSIMISEPTAGATITNPLTINGTTNFWPFEATLTSRLLDANGHVIGIGPVMVQAPDIGQGGPFTAELSFIAPDVEQQGTLELFEASAKDGSIVVKQSVPVRLAGKPDSEGVQLDSPRDGIDVTLPVHVALRMSKPAPDITARLRYSNGVVLEQHIAVVTDSNGIGYAVGNMHWNTESAPPETPAGWATFEVVRDDGTVLKQVNVHVLPDSETQLVDVAWVTPDTQQEIVFKQAVGREPQIASAALRELLNGPPDGNAAGAQTALPTVGEIINYPGRTADWGYEVKLHKLTITNGVATANFSKELRAYGGGAARVQMIRQQIERTLRQFPSVQEVVIQIEGESEGVLEP